MGHERQRSAGCLSSMYCESVYARLAVQHFKKRDGAVSCKCTIALECLGSIKQPRRLTYLGLRTGRGCFPDTFNHSSFAHAVRSLATTTVYSLPHVALHLPPHDLLSGRTDYILR